MTDISVVMTTFNRADLLAQTLDSLVAAHTQELSWELVVVDNNSTDYTPAVLERYRDRLPLTIGHETRRGYAKAKNHGLDTARGRLIVFTDDDVIVDPDWLQSLFAASQRWPDAGIFGGRIQPLLPDELPEWLQGQAMQERMTQLFGHYHPAPTEAPTQKPPVGVNFAVRAAAMADLRLDENRGADGTENYIQSAEIDFIRQLIDAGQRIVYVPTALVRHVVRSEQLTLASLNKRSFRRGRNNAVRDHTPYHARGQIAGAPAGLWLTVAKLQLRLWSQWPRSQETRYPIEDKLAFKRGALYQLRMQHREQAEP